MSQIKAEACKLVRPSDQIQRRANYQLHINGRIMLKWIVEKLVVKMWIGLSTFMTGSNGEFL
jgi:hypothetical protein